MPFEPVDPEAFKRGMRHLAAAVTVVTTEFEGRWRGLTATAVCSVSASPPTLLACISRKATAHRLIVASRRFCVNVLASEHVEVSHRFAGREASAERFRDGEWEQLVTGAPVLKGALASFDCEAVQDIDITTHTILIGRVVAVATRTDCKPLLYADGGYMGITLFDVQGHGAPGVATTAPLFERDLDEL